MKRIIFSLLLLAVFGCKTTEKDDNGPSPDPIPEPTPSPSPGPKPPVPKALHIDAPKWLKIKAGSEVALQVLPKPDETYVWSTGEAGPKIWVKPAASASYVVTAVHVDGRSTSAVITVTVEP